MYWTLADLDGPLRLRLAMLPQAAPADLGPHYLERRPRMRKLAGAFAIGLLITGLLAGMLLASTHATPESARNALIGALILLPIPGTWTIVLLIEIIRAAASPQKPFLLVTPKMIVEADYGQGQLQLLLLKEATDFKKVESYDQKQNYEGRKFSFSFGKASYEFLVKDPASIARVEEVLAIAQQGTAGRTDLGTGGEDLVPSKPGSPAAPGLRSFTDPFGIFWLAVLGIVIILVIAAIILGRIFG